MAVSHVALPAAARSPPASIKVLQGAQEANCCSASRVNPHPNTHTGWRVFSPEGCRAGHPVGSLPACTASPPLLLRSPVHRVPRLTVLSSLLERRAPNTPWRDRAAGDAQQQSPRLLPPPLTDVECPCLSQSVRVHREDTGVQCGGGGGEGDSSPVSAACSGGCMHTAPPQRRRQQQQHQQPSASVHFAGEEGSSCADLDAAAVEAVCARLAAAAAAQEQQRSGQHQHQVHGCAWAPRNEPAGITRGQKGRKAAAALATTTPAAAPAAGRPWKGIGMAARQPWHAAAAVAAPWRPPGGPVASGDAAPPAMGSPGWAARPGSHCGRRREVAAKEAQLERVAAAEAAARLAMARPRGWGLKEGAAAAVMDRAVAQVRTHAWWGRSHGCSHSGRPGRELAVALLSAAAEVLAAEALDAQQQLDEEAGDAGEPPAATPRAQRSGRLLRATQEVLGRRARFMLRRHHACAMRRGLGERFHALLASSGSAGAVCEPSGVSIRQRAGASRGAAPTVADRPPARRRGPLGEVQRGTAMVLQAHGHRCRQPLGSSAAAPVAPGPAAAASPVSAAPRAVLMRPAAAAPPPRGVAGSDGVPPPAFSGPPVRPKTVEQLLVEFAALIDEAGGAQQQLSEAHHWGAARC
jgi:hypothetical protein